MCSEETQEKRILESDIFRILESEGVTEISTQYKVSVKVSPLKFVLVLGNFKVHIFNAVLAIQKFVLISSNELVLSELGGNLSL